jgi:predicted type IV restriction endonuclease
MDTSSAPDNAFTILRQIRAEFSEFLAITPDPTEADTRAKLVDRIITEVCCWPEQLVRREEHVQVGYIDYSLLVRGRPYVATEAKKSGVSFSLPITSSKSLKLSGPILTDKSVSAALKQVRGYCDEGGIRYGIATNGHAWIVFRAIREDIPWREGYAHLSEP